jgi:hypothetical protein
MSEKQTGTLIEVESSIGETVLKFTVTGGSLFDLELADQNKVLRIGKMVKQAGIVKAKPGRPAGSRNRQKGNHEEVGSGPA